jgi:hypothetical protein
MRYFITSLLAVGALAQSTEDYLKCAAWEVLSLQLVKADGSMLPIAALCGLLGVVRVVSGLGWGSYGAFEVVFG